MASLSQPGPPLPCRGGGACGAGTGGVLEVCTSYQRSADFRHPSGRACARPPPLQCRGGFKFLQTQRRERSEANRGRRCAKPSDYGMTTRKPFITRTNGQILRIDTHQKRFSLESEGFLLAQAKEISQKWVAGTFVPASPRLRAGRRQMPPAAGRGPLDSAPLMS